MRKQAKARKIGELLDELYPEPPIPLDHHDPFTLLVAVLLSAQTTDKRVNLVTPELFRRAPTPDKLLALGEEEVLRLIRTCGLAPQKARALIGLAGMLLSEHGGEVPADLEALEKLPGVGHKTASVVMCQAFGQPAFPVDTHIHRLARRWGLSSGKNVKTTEADLKALYPQEQWNRLHLQIIYFGREHCPARTHDFDNCPICSFASTKRTRALDKPKTRKRTRKSKGRSRGS